MLGRQRKSAHAARKAALRERDKATRELRKKIRRATGDEHMKLQAELRALVLAPLTVDGQAVADGRGPRGRGPRGRGGDLFSWIFDMFGGTSAPAAAPASSSPEPTPAPVTSPTPGAVLGFAQELASRDAWTSTQDGRSAGW
jgi:biotin carboxyl carrier protein